jgi:ribulose kinase
MEAVIGVDVGTGSARAGVFDAEGRMLGQASRAIKAWRPEADFVQLTSGPRSAPPCARRWAWREM